MSRWERLHAARKALAAELPDAKDRTLAKQAIIAELGEEPEPFYGPISFSRGRHFGCCGSNTPALSALRLAKGET